MPSHASSGRGLLGSLPSWRSAGTRQAQQRFACRGPACAGSGSEATKPQRPRGGGSSRLGTPHSLEKTRRLFCRGSGGAGAAAGTAARRAGRTGRAEAGGVTPPGAQAWLWVSPGCLGVTLPPGGAQPLGADRGWQRHRWPGCWADCLLSQPQSSWICFLPKWFCCPGKLQSLLGNPKQPSAVPAEAWRGDTVPTMLAGASTMSGWSLPAWCSGVGSAPPGSPGQLLLPPRSPAVPCGHQPGRASGCSAVPWFPARVCTSRLASAIPSATSPHWDSDTVSAQPSKSTRYPGTDKNCPSPVAGPPLGLEEDAHCSWPGSAICHRVTQIINISMGSSWGSSQPPPWGPCPVPGLPHARPLPASCAGTGCTGELLWGRELCRCWQFVSRAAPRQAAAGRLARRACAGVWYPAGIFRRF